MDDADGGEGGIEADELALTLEGGGTVEWAVGDVASTWELPDERVVNGRKGDTTDELTFALKGGDAIDGDGDGHGVDHEPLGQSQEPGQVEINGGAHVVEVAAFKLVTGADAIALSTDGEGEPARDSDGAAPDGPTEEPGLELGSVEKELKVPVNDTDGPALNGTEDDGAGSTMLGSTGEDEFALGGNELGDAEGAVARVGPGQVAEILLQRVSTLPAPCRDFSLSSPGALGDWA